MFVGPLNAEDKLPRDALPGRLLTGKVQLAKASESAGAKEAPGFIPFTFMCALIFLHAPTTSSCTLHQGDVAQQMLCMHKLLSN